MKILDLIPENLHDQLYKEVAEVLAEKEKEKKDKAAKSVSKQDIDAILDTIMPKG